MQVYPHLVKGTPEFTKFRGYAKRIAFGYQYGQALPGMIASNKDIEPDVVKKVFKSLEEIHNAQKQLVTYLKSSTSQTGYFEALHGRIFSLPRDKGSGRVIYTHLILNYLCQGTGAIFLKRGVRDSYNYSLAHPEVDVKMMNTVHDEIQYDFKLDAKNIRALFNYNLLMISHEDIDFPITSDIEIAPYS